MARRGPSGLLRRAMRTVTPLPLGLRLSALHAGAQGFHEVHHVGWFGFLWSFDLLAMGLAFDEVLQSLFVPIFEFLWMEMSLFRLDDVCGEIEHLFRHFLARKVAEIILLIAHFVGVPDRNSHHPFAARF